MLGAVHEPDGITVGTPPQRFPDRTGLHPAARPIELYSGCFAIDFEETQDRGTKVRRIEKHGCETRTPNHVQRILRRVADLAFGIDRQPGFTVGGQHIGVVQVTVHKGGGLIRAEVAESSQRGIEDAGRYARVRSVARSSSMAKCSSARA